MKRGSYSSCSEDSDYVPGGKRQWRKIGRPGRPSPANVSKPHGRPVEIFRTDLISAMKLADSGPLVAGEFHLLADPWRPEWERGVQVPVSPHAIPVPSFRVLSNWCGSDSEESQLAPDLCDPDPDLGDGVRTPTRGHDPGEEVTQYDLDEVDVSWLRAANDEMRKMGLPPVRERSLEAALSRLEQRCAESARRALSTEAALGIEFDADVVCDVCRSPHAEDGNEMVFCDKCDVCVHQACYGIASVPAGSWLCRVCDRGVAAPRCQLCPRRDGAMKPTHSRGKWAHVSCALWIPEVSIGCPEKMEPITRLSLIPPTRWALLCCLCCERAGACIQCSEHTCVRAFHVTCGFQGGLEMATFLDERTDRVRFRSYCPEHTSQRRLRPPAPPRPSDPVDRSLPPSPEFPDAAAATPTSSMDWEWDAPAAQRPAEATAGAAGPRRGGRQPATAHDAGDEDAVAELRRERLRRLEEEFYTLAGAGDAAPALGRAGSPLLADLVYQFWKLRRKSGFDRPLVAAPSLAKPAAVTEAHRPPPTFLGGKSSPARYHDGGGGGVGERASSPSSDETEDDKEEEEAAVEESLTRHRAMAAASGEEESAAQRDMNTLTHLRQNLERARNLCYMVSRREKLKGALARLHEQLFWKHVQLALSSPAGAAADNGRCERPPPPAASRRPRRAARHRTSRSRSRSGASGGSASSVRGDSGSGGESSGAGRAAAPRRRKRRRHRARPSAGRRRVPATVSATVAADPAGATGPKRRGRRGKSAAAAAAAAANATAPASRKAGPQTGPAKARAAKSVPAGLSTNWGGFRIPKKPGGSGGAGGAGGSGGAGAKSDEACDGGFGDLEEDVGAAGDCDAEAEARPLADGPLWSLTGAAPARELWPFGRFRTEGAGEPVKAGVSIIC